MNSINSYDFTDDSSLSIESFYHVKRQVNRTVRLCIAGISVAVVLGGGPIDTYSYQNSDFNISKNEICLVSAPICEIRDNKVFSFADVPINSLNYAISSIGNYSENWDGYGARAIPDAVISNSHKFVKALWQEGFALPYEDDIVATPYGTIVLEVTTKRGLVSMEISSSEIGFFTEFEDGHNYGSEGIQSSFESVPEQLKSVLV